MTRLIDADALEYHKQLECMGNGQYEDVKVVYEGEIDNAPTIDAEPVVRCIDCIFWYDCEYSFKSENGFCCCGAKE